MLNNTIKLKKIKVRSAKNKGKRFQNWVAEQISSTLGIKWGKDELIASREMGQSGPDVRLIGQAKDLFPFVVECKNQEKWDVPGWIDQAKSHRIADNCISCSWLLFIKRNRLEPVVVMDAKDFFDLWGDYTEALKIVSEKSEKPKGILPL